MRVLRTLRRYWVTVAMLVSFVVVNVVESVATVQPAATGASDRPAAG